jgi:predicted short-subunit dehydrogenase-like oxidoreductase (DUF2520 family)
MNGTRVSGAELRTGCAACGLLIWGKRFLVCDAKRELCHVAMPLASVENLAHLFPDDDLKVVQAKGIDINGIVVRARETGYAPQTLIDLQTGVRSYRIWIR